MPRFDVDDGFDPDFLDRILVVRRLDDRDAGGRTRRTVVEVHETDAVVEPVSDAVDTAEDVRTSTRVVTVTTRFRLRGPVRASGPRRPGFQPDVVVLDSSDGEGEPSLAERYAADPGAFDRFEVSDLSDFSRYGRGFVVATCVLTDLQPVPPTGGLEP